MIDKAVLDALAVVIKKERTRFQDLILELKQDITAADEVSDLWAKEFVTAMELRLSVLTSAIEAYEAGIDSKISKGDATRGGDIESRFLVIEAAWHKFKDTVATDLAEAIKLYGLDLKADISGTMASLDERGMLLVDEVRAELALIKNGVDGETGPRGKDGDHGKDGVAGKDGKQGQIGEQGETGADGERSERGEKGADGNDGADGADGQSGIQGVAGVHGDIGNTGKDGPAGADGADGNDGRDGRDGSDGIDRDMVAPREVAADEKLDKGELVYSQGGLFQSIRKTTGCPKNDPGSYRMVLNGITRVKECHIEEEHLTRISIRSSDGTTAVMDIPDGHDGSDGNEGPTGQQGIRGRKGIKGDAGISIEDILVQNQHIIITLTNGEVQSFPVPKQDLPKPTKMQGVHVRAPSNPPKDYLWVSRTGRSKIWDGKLWITLK